MLQGHPIGSAKEVRQLIICGVCFFCENRGNSKPQLEHFAEAPVLSPREIMPAECMVRRIRLHVTLLLSSLMQCDSVRASEQVQANLPKQSCSRRKMLHDVAEAVTRKVNFRCCGLFNFRILRNECRLTSSSVSTFL
jgi:hypothetical protein